MSTFKMLTWQLECLCVTGCEMFKRNQLFLSLHLHFTVLHFKNGEAIICCHLQYSLAQPLFWAIWLHSSDDNCYRVSILILFFHCFSHLSRTQFHHHLFLFFSFSLVALPLGFTDTQVRQVHPPCCLKISVTWSNSSGGVEIYDWKSILRDPDQRVLQCVLTCIQVLMCQIKSK